MKKSSFIYGSLILAIVNFIVRLIGFTYKIVLSKLIGPEGIGLFQMVFPVLMVFITLTTAGIPIGVSKLVSKYSSLNDYYNVKKVLRLAIIITLFFALVLAALLLFFSDLIALKFLKNTDLLYSVKFLAPGVIFISLASTIRGYFYGLKRIKPAGAAQIIEQIARIAFVIGIIYYYYPVSPRFGAFVAICGISVGEAFGLLWLIIHLQKDRNEKNITKSRSVTTLNILTNLSYIATPITLSRFINVILQLFNAILIPQRLVVAGYTNREAISIFGRVLGMSMPLIFLPFIVTSAMVINIIPNISEALELKQYSTIRSHIALAIRITLLISIPLTALYIFFSKPLSLLIYDDIKVGEYLSILGYSTVFLSLYHTLSGILHALGKQVIATINYLAGMSLQLLSIYYLVSHPSFGINGFFIGFIATTIVISLLNFFSVNKEIHIKIHIGNTITKPIIATGAMIICAMFLYQQLSQTLNSQFIVLAVSLILGGFIYVIMLFIIKGLPKSILKRLF